MIPPWTQARNDRNRAAGCCIVCGKPAVVKNGKPMSRCAAHRDKANAYAAKDRTGKKYVCSVCGEAGHNSRSHAVQQE